MAGAGSLFWAIAIAPVAKNPAPVPSAPTSHFQPLQLCHRTWQSIHYTTLDRPIARGVRCYYR